jgi:small-conductance mechanosensitive channel
MDSYDAIRIYDASSIKDVQDQVDKLRHENEELRASSGRVAELEAQVERLQNTVLRCRRPRTASALILLMRHFKVKINVFKAEEVNLDDLRTPK